MGDSIRKQLCTRLFGELFLLERRWERLGDQALAATGVTTKQWLMLATVGSLSTEPPSLGEVAEQMHTSHQNARAIAGRLEQRGLLALERDARDRRVLRLRLTEASDRFWAEREDRDEAFIAGLFEGLSDEEVQAFAGLMGRMHDRAAALLGGGR